MRTSRSFLQISLLGLAFAALTALPAAATPQGIAPQGKINVVVTDASTAKALEIGADETLYALDMILVAHGKRRGGLLHHMSGHCLAHEVAENATGASTIDGYCTYVDADGDKIFETMTMTRSSVSDESTGDATITGGTGKYEGITGELTHTRRLLLPSPADGVFPGVGRITGSYQIQ